MNLGDIFPNFLAKTTIGEIDFHKWIDNEWAILFSHPADYTPVTFILSTVCHLSLINVYLIIRFVQLN